MQNPTTYINGQASEYIEDTDRERIQLRLSNKIKPGYAMVEWTELVEWAEDGYHDVKAKMKVEDVLDYIEDEIDYGLVYDEGEARFVIHLPA